MKVLSHVVSAGLILGGLLLLMGCPPPTSSGSSTPSSPVAITVSHFVGSPSGALSQDGTGTTALFSHPFGIATDGSTYIYVADYGGHTIRRVTIATGVTTTIAGIQTKFGTSDGTGTAALFAHPAGVVLSPDNSMLYIADLAFGLIRQLVLSTGVVTTLAGSASGTSEADGVGSSASFAGPTNLAIDGTGVGTNLYVTDQWGGTVRKVVISTGQVSTLAGSAGNNSELDGTGSGAHFNNPFGIATDGAGNLYVSDYNGPTIRKLVISTGVVTTLAGSSGNYNEADSTSGYSGAAFSNPAGMVYVSNSGTNYLLVSDTGPRTIRKINLTTPSVTSIAGNNPPGWADGSTPSSPSLNNLGNISFNNPQGLAYSTAGSGTLYIADTYNNAIRSLTTGAGPVYTSATLAGATTLGAVNATGSSARFNSPQATFSDGTNLYVADQFNGTIRQIVLATGVTSTFAGSPGNIGEMDGTGSAAQFGAPIGIVGDANNLYVVDMWGNTVRQVVIATRVVTTLAGNKNSSGEVDGQGTAAQFNNPTSITTDGTDLFVTDQYGPTIRKVTKAGLVSTLAGSNNNYGELDGTGASAKFGQPIGITSDGTNLYVVDYGGATVRKIVISSAAVTTLAGTANQHTQVDGIGTAAQFANPYAVTYDSAGGCLYVADQTASTIRKILLATSSVTTLAGQIGLAGIADGVGTAALFDLPGPMSVVGNSLYVSQPFSSNNIRKIVLR